jgi:hypothetical protein
MDMLLSCAVASALITAGCLLVGRGARRRGWARTARVTRTASAHMIRHTFAGPAAATGQRPVMRRRGAASEPIAPVQ